MKNQLIAYCIALVSLYCCGAILKYFLISQEFVLLLGIGVGLIVPQTAREIETRLNRRKK